MGQWQNNGQSVADETQNVLTSRALEIPKCSQQSSPKPNTGAASENFRCQVPTLQLGDNTSPNILRTLKPGALDQNMRRAGCGVVLLKH